MSRRAFVVLSLQAVLFVAVSAFAQQVPALAQTGGVSGHVYFAGTNAPARFATVALQPIEVKSEDRGPSERQADPAIHVYQTSLDGSFQISHVPPGTYYVVIKHPGYLSPFSQFTDVELAHPTPAMQQGIAATLPTVIVTGNNVANIDVQLVQGASVNGRVIFDDGTPFSGADVTLMHRKADGKLESIHLVPRKTTDDQGRFRMAGLPGGEYILKVQLELSDALVSSVLGDSSSRTGRTSYQLTYFSGDTPRQRDIKPFKLDDGQDSVDSILTIPISKLHAVSGAIVEQRTGRAINKGRVALLYADDHSQLTTAEVSPDDPAFHFSFVPEGDYVIQVVEAEDARREEIPNPPPNWPPSTVKDTVIRRYGPSEPQPLVIHGDMSGINLGVTAASSEKAVQ